MDFTLRIWRQEGPDRKGTLASYAIAGISPDCSFLEMLETLNERLEEQGVEPVAFERDCMEGICGSCSLVIGGIAHGPEKGVTTCQLHMRSFPDGALITVEPFRARAFPVLRDLIVDRSAFDRIIQAGGYISVNAGGAPDANSLSVAREKANLAMDGAACIGCGACVASCKNAAAMLFTGAKVSHLSLLPQGQPERRQRALSMVRAMDQEGFGCCTNQYECEAVCPKEISVRFIARLNREYLFSSLLDDSDA